MFAARRILPFVLIFAPITIAIVLLDAGFHLSEHLWPHWLPHSRPGTAYENGLELLVIAAEKELEKRIVDPEIPLVVIVGQSSLRSGISIATLNEKDGIDARYLVLGGAGKGMAPLLRTLEPLRRSSLRPDVVLLGFHNFYLADRAPSLTPLSRRDQRAENLSSWERLIQFPDSFLWMAARRQDLSMEIDWFFADLRAQLAHMMGHSLGVHELGKIDPWAEPYWHWEGDVPFSAEMTAKAAAGLAFEPEAYSRDPVALEEFMNAIRWILAKGSRVGILNMPQHSSLRELTPPEALHALSDPLAKTFPASRVRIFDLRDTLPDSAFLDPVHYAPEGRDFFSTELAPQIATFFEANGNASN